VGQGCSTRRDDCGHHDYVDGDGDDDDDDDDDDTTMMILMICC